MIFLGGTSGFHYGQVVLQIHLSVGQVDFLTKFDPCIHIVSIGIQIFQTPPLIFPQDHILLCHVCYIRRFQFFGTIQQSVKFCEVLGLWITNPHCQHCTLVEELYQLNIPWKQVKCNTHNAYQAVSRVLHEFITCVTRVN